MRYKRTNWPSWIQAISSVVALSITTWLYYDASSRDQKQALSTVTHRAINLKEAIHQQKRRCLNPDEFNLSIRDPSLVLELTVISSPALPPDKLPEDAIGPYFNLLKNSLELVVISTHFKERDLNPAARNSCVEELARLEKHTEDLIYQFKEARSL